MSKMHFSRFICVAVVALLCGIAAGCGSPSAARRMAEAEETIDTNPDSALAILRTIDPSRLRGEQRALHALLSVKATDKAYLPHRSDSTALIALDYYGDRMAGLRTAEAHYYAGRVAYDLADYPRALKAFHLALRSIEETSDTSTRVQKLKSAIVSQQAQLLTRLRLFNEARPFYREAIKSDSILGETSFMFYDIRDLAFTYLEEHNTDSARIILNRALPVCHGVVPEADTELYSLLALSYLKDRQYDRAAEFIDSIDPYIEHGDRSLTLSIVAQIYDKIGRMDSAVHFAKNLSDNPEFNLNKFAGHRILAKNSLRSRNIDTIAAYHDSLAQFSVKMLDQHALGLNLPGTMFYRLMTTELDNSRLQTRNDTLALSVYALALLAAACIIIILVALYRRTYQRQKEDETIAHLQQVVLTRPVVPGEETYDLPKVTTTRESLVANLLQRMEHLARQPYQIPSELANASVVGTIRGMIADKQRLDSSSRIWTELEKAVCHASPNFKSDIYLLLNNSSTNDYHISLLIKAGFTPTEIALLLNRAKGTVSSNRQRMCERIFKQKLSNTLFDSLIRTL